MINEEKYLQTVNMELGKGQKLKLVGCNHGGIMRKSDLSKRRGFYEKQFDWADIVILEQPIIREFYQPGFSSHLGKMAYERDKPVWIIDPNSEKANNFQWDICRTYKKEGKILNMPGAIEEGYSHNLSKEKFEKENQEFNHIVYANTRKDYWWRWSYGKDDWRDIVIAKGLDEKISRFDFKNILAIHGGLHTKPIEFYLKNPEIREAKLRRRYTTFSELGRQGIRIFTPGGDLCGRDQSWELNVI